MHDCGESRRDRRTQEWWRDSLRPLFERLNKIPNNFCNVVKSTEVVKSNVSEHPELFQGSQMVM